MSNNPTNCYQSVTDFEDVKNYQQQLQEQEQRAKKNQGICLLFISAFLYSLMGLFVQLSGDMGVPSTELVFIRSVFQGIFVVIGMIFFRLDDIQEADIDDDIEASNVNIHQDVDLTPIYDELLEEEKRIKEFTEYKTSRMNEKASLLAKYQEPRYGTLSLSSSIPRIIQCNNYQTIERFQEPNTFPPRIIEYPFGTTPAMREIVIFRGIIGSLGFVSYFYTFSVLPLGDATTLLSLYPIITIFMARVVLGEKMQPIHLVAAMFSVMGATLIARPTFLYGSETMDDDLHLSPTLGYLSAMVGSCCASGVIIAIHKAGKTGAHTLQLLFSWVVCSVYSSLIIGFIAARYSADQQWHVPTKAEIPYLLGVCIPGTLAHFGLNYASRLLPATLAGLIRSSDIFYAYVLEIIVLGEHPASVTLWGVFFVCSSIVIVLFSSEDETEEKMKHGGSDANLTAASSTTG